ncbi:MAG: pitrilysin family protein [Bacillota bacterium]
MEKKTIPGQIDVYVIPTDKFKTVLVTVLARQLLSRELASKTALLPSVMERGSRDYPTYRDLMIRLEELYGAGFSSDVLKKGEKQVLSFSLEVINDLYAPGKELLRQGTAMLRSVLNRPLLENGGFKQEYVEQEKEQLAKEIKGLVNDKVNYALERCVQEMCKDEPFGVYKYGSIEELERITPESLYEYYRQLLAENPLDIYIVGEVEPEAAFALAEETFARPDRERRREMPPDTVNNIPVHVRYHEEKMPVSQGKITLGYRTNTAYRDDDYVALLFYNGVLGGFPHSKLFQNVREKASLAYYAFSRLEKHKGIQLIGSGIEVENYQRALEIIMEQVELIKKGEINHEEMENTRRGLINQFKIIADSPYNMLGLSLDGLLGEKQEGVDYYLRKVEEVKVDDVVAAAHKVYLDTVYFLRSEGDVKA